MVPKFSSFPIQSNNLIFFRSWKKKEIKEEIVVDEALQQVFKSFINFDDIFEAKELSTEESK